MPSAVEMPSSLTKSTTGSAAELSPLMTTPRKVSVSTAPVGSLRADSAMIVCEILGRILIRSKSGMRIAGSVGASAAPISRPMEYGTSKTAYATVPTMTAVMITPGITSIPSPTATWLSTRAESCRPPWKRMNETPRVKQHVDAGGAERDVDQIRDRGTDDRARGEQEQHAGETEEVGDRLGDEARPPASRRS